MSHVQPEATPGYPAFPEMNLPTPGGEGAPIYPPSPTLLRPHHRDLEVRPLECSAPSVGPWALSRHMSAEGRWPVSSPDQGLLRMELSP